MIPKIDSEIGISVYATQSNGIGGRIKTSNDTFIVKEILSDKALKSISDNNGFSVYILQKNGIDTMHALRDVEKRFGLVLKSMGLKDANALTEQYVFSKTISKSFEKIEGKNYAIGNHHFFSFKIVDLISKQMQKSINYPNCPYTRFRGLRARNKKVWLCKEKSLQKLDNKSLTGG